MKNIKLVLEYDGTNYCGWQVQPHVVTLQGTLENAIFKVSGEKVRVTASGRTDGGVHAWGQVANFHTDAVQSGRAWQGGLNHFLPPDMRVLDASEANPEFHSRHSAKGKLYEYIVVNRFVHSPIRRSHAWHVGVHLDLDAMTKAAAHLLGEHDFTSLRAVACDAKNPVRELRSLSITKDGDAVKFRLGANAFLRHMVRNIVGTLVEVGRGRMKPDYIPALLDARDRMKAGPTAPPQGLYLVEVEYDNE
ncbi:MAG: tRNA pseudouridine(38-40) synthase TruA [Nitrospirae bacterium]|nr:tRNA pseudouridine(38-40) synthase TruA [Nitrospirota bacterium]